jgi:hypothetical protein
VSKPGDDVLNTTDELLEDIKEAVNWKAETRGETLEGVLTRAGDADVDRSRSSPGIEQAKRLATIALVMRQMVNMLWYPAATFTAYDCNNRSSLVETYFLLSWMCAQPPTGSVRWNEQQEIAQVRTPYAQVGGRCPPAIRDHCRCTQSIQLCSHIWEGILGYQGWRIGACDEMHPGLVEVVPSSHKNWTEGTTEQKPL